jgi:hypothetical protein
LRAGFLGFAVFFAVALPVVLRLVEVFFVFAMSFPLGFAALPCVTALAILSPALDNASMAKKRRKARTPKPASFASGVVQFDPTGNAPASARSRPEGAGKDPAAVALGRKGGLKGGPARAAKMTKAERVASAKKAAAARWAKRQDQRPR